MAYYELKIAISGRLREPFIRFLNKKRSLGLIEDDRMLTAYFPAGFDIVSLVRELDIMNAVLDRTIHQEATFSYTLIAEQDWNESWKNSFTPIDIGERFTILPPWENPRPGRVNLIIDPGMAFGTGHHETTRSCLTLLEKYESRASKDRFLDLGTGTGLLALAAAKMGYRRVVAVDTDPLAIEAANRNVALNRITDIAIHEGSFNQVSNTFDCITANIISGVLILLASGIASHLNARGLAILSGILPGQAGEVAAAMDNQGLVLKEKYRDGKWISLVVRNNP